MICPGCLPCSMLSAHRAAPNRSVPVALQQRGPSGLHAASLVPPPWPSVPDAHLRLPWRPALSGRRSAPANCAASEQQSHSASCITPIPVLLRNGRIGFRVDCACLFTFCNEMKFIDFNHLVLLTPSLSVGHCSDVTYIQSITRNAVAAIILIGYDYTSKTLDAFAFT